MIETQKEVNFLLNKRVDDIESEITAMENEIKTTQQEIQKCYSLMHKREQDLEILNRKLDHITSKNAVRFPNYKVYKIRKYNIFFHLGINFDAPRDKNNNSGKEFDRNDRK